MKFIALLLFFYSSFVFAGPPLGVSGQSDSSNKYPSVIKVPNNQLTDIGGGKALIQTGNNNILSNGSFEHSTVQSNWSLTNGSSASEASTKIHGEQSIKLTLTAQALEFFQTSTRYAAQFADGVQGVAWARVKTSVSGVFVCSIQNSAINYSNCAAHSGSGKWELLKVPFVLGGTNNGIAVISGTLSSGTVTPGNITGTVYVDDGYVGTDAGIADVSVVTPWQVYTPTFTGFGTVSNVDCRHRQVGSNREIDCKFTSGTSTATEARISLPSGDTSSSSFSTIKVAGVGFKDTSGGPVTVPLIEPSVSYLTFSFATPGGTTTALTKANGNALAASGQTFSFLASVPIANLAGSTQVFATNCGANCENDITFYSSGAGAVSRENVDIVNGNCVVTDTSLFTCTLNSGLSGALNCDADIESSSNTDTSFANISSSSASQIVVRTGYSSGAGAVITKTAYPFTVRCSKNGADYTPSRTIVGSFKDNLIVPSSGAKAVLVSAQITDGASTTTVSEEDDDFINGNCTNVSTGQYGCTFQTGYWAAAPHCWTSTDTRTIPGGTNATTSSVSPSFVNDSGGGTDTNFRLFCKGKKP